MTTAPIPIVEAEPLLRVLELEVQFPIPGAWTPAISDVSFDVGRNEVVGIVGESGSGKSVTALTIMGLVQSAGARIARGSVRFAGRELIGLPPTLLNRIRGKRLTMIFQDPMSSLNPAYTVGEQVAEILRRHEGLGRGSAWNRATALLDLVGIPSAHRRVAEYPHSFSGGMRQRVMIAIALACHPELIIADEPTTALDATIQAQILALLKGLQADLGVSLILITHDLGLLADFADRVLVMYSGHIVEERPTRALFRAPVHPYTSGLLAAMPHFGGGRDGTFIPGSVPSIGQWPSGCRFHPRCGHADRQRCASSPIELKAVWDGRVRCVRAGELTLVGVQ